MVELKRCPTCAEMKHKEDFHKDSRAKDKLAWQCKKCTLSMKSKVRKEKARVDNMVIDFKNRVINLDELLANKRLKSLSFNPSNHLYIELKKGGE